MRTCLIASLSMCLVLSSLAVRAGRVQAQAAPPGMQQVIGDGLRLQVTIPRLSYPRAALVRVTIRLTNLSPHAIDVTGNDAPMCASRNGLGIEVQTRTGRQVYPPAATWELASCGPFVSPTVLPPGKSIVDHPLIVVRGSRVRAIVSVGKVNHPTKDLTTPALDLKLTPRDRPPFTFSTEGGPQFTIGPASWKHSALYFVESGVCFHPGGTGEGSGSPAWARVPARPGGTYYFGMACDGSASWSFTGGMLNQSVVSETVHT